jgi:hypothetical protein
MIDEALADGVLTDDEYRRISDAATEAGLDEAMLRSEMVAKVQPHAQKLFDGIIEGVRARREMSPNDEVAIDHLVASLRMGIRPDTEALKPYKLLWAINHGEVPEVEEIRAPIILGKGERCFFGASAVWCQIKTITHHQGYVGGSIRFRVARGVSVGLGRYLPVSTKQDEMTPISEGDIYLTDRRLVFVGAKRSNETKYAQVVQVEPYTDGISVAKAKGVPDLYVLKHSSDAAGAEAIIRLFAGQ